MLDGLKIGVACIERDELEKFVTEAAVLGLLEVDVVDGKFVLNSELTQLKKEVDEYKEAEALKAVGDKDWESI